MLFWRSGAEERVVYSKGSSPNRPEGLPEVIAGCASAPISQRDKQNDSIMTFIKIVFSFVNWNSDRYNSCIMGEKCGVLWEKVNQNLKASAVKLLFGNCYISLMLLSKSIHSSVEHFCFEGWIRCLQFCWHVHLMTTPHRNDCIETRGNTLKQSQSL